MKWHCNYELLKYYIRLIFFVYNICYLYSILEFAVIALRLILIDCSII